MLHAVPVWMRQLFIAATDTENIPVDPGFFSLKLFFFWNADGTQTAIAGKTKRKWSKTGWFTWANVFALLIPNYLNAYYSYSSDFQPQGRYSMPMLIPLMYLPPCAWQPLLWRQRDMVS